MNPILANAAASEINLSNGVLPRDVQWMPPGRQMVQPMGFDQPFEMNVTPAIAAAADRQLQALRRKAEAGQDVEPYFDFNHKDEGRAFKPLRFYWAGEDPKTGGIRAEGQWTGAGAKAVLDGELCCVSASWVLNKHTKEFLGIRHNVGGLVPRSAFHSIQAFAKAEAVNHNNKHDNTMTKEEFQQLLADGLKPINEKITALEANAKASQVTTATANAAAGDNSKIVTLITDALKPVMDRLQRIEDGGKNAIQANAKKTVEEIGIKAGRISSQDKETIAFWEGAISADAKAADALAKMPTNSAFIQVVQAGANGGSTTGTAGECEFVAKAKAYAKENNISDVLEAEAKFAGTPEGRKLYETYLETLAPRR